MPVFRYVIRGLAVAAAAVLLFSAACSSKPRPVGVVAPEHLAAILLPAPDLNGILGASKLQSDEVRDSTTTSAKTISDQDCLGAIYSAQVGVYRRTGFTAISRSETTEPGDQPDHLVDEAAVGFPSATDALNFVDASLNKWKTCAGKTVTTTEGDNATTGWQLGQPSGSAPKITTVATQVNGDGWACHRALSAVSNVVVDVTACGKNITDQAAQIGDKMAGKVSGNESAAPPPPAHPAQTTLPFNGLFAPSNVALDSAGNFYVTDSGNHRVVKLVADSRNQTELPFGGLDNPNGLAVDTAGDVYVTDSAAGQVLELVAGSSNPIRLPFSDLKSPAGICVDAQNNVYVTDYDTNRVFKLAAGSTTQTELPFTGLVDPDGVKVDTAGDVYVTAGGSNRVAKLPAGSNTSAELPFSDLSDPSDVTLDSGGNVYVTNHHNNRVLKLANGSNSVTELPFTGLSDPTSAAVDSAGNVYVTDSNNDRVVKLPPR